MDGLRPKVVLLLLFITIAGLLLGYPPTVCMAQSNPGSGGVKNLQLSFHGYSLILRAENNSLCVYDGADGLPPSTGNAISINLAAQIPGQYSGFSYWSAVMMWVVKLDSDVHVQGTVNMHAYISSTFNLGGLFSGSGYGMGIVDIDENNNEVKEFITEGPTAIGKNQFSAQPSQYSVNVNVDYIFKKGHTIGFVVGLGATAQGFTATVYFGSNDRNSGATLPVAETIETKSFLTKWNGDEHRVIIMSSSALSNYQFDSSKKSIQFQASGIKYTSGYCEVWIPRTLMQGPFTVSSSTKQITPTISENSTYSHLTFTHLRSPDTIIITGASPSGTPIATPTSTPSGTQPSSTPTATSTPASSGSPPSNIPTPTPIATPTSTPSGTQPSNTPSDSPQPSSPQPDNTQPGSTPTSSIQPDNTQSSSTQPSILPTNSIEPSGKGDPAPELTILFIVFILASTVALVLILRGKLFVSNKRKNHLIYNVW